MAAGSWTTRWQSEECVVVDVKMRKQGASPTPDRTDRLVPARLQHNRRTKSALARRPASTVASQESTDSQPPRCHKPGGRRRQRQQKHNAEHEPKKSLSPTAPPRATTADRKPPATGRPAAPPAMAGRRAPPAPTPRPAALTYRWAPESASPGGAASGDAGAAWAARGPARWQCPRPIRASGGDQTAAGRDSASRPTPPPAPKKSHKKPPTTRRREKPQHQQGGASRQPSRPRPRSRPRTGGRRKSDSPGGLPAATKVPPA